MSAQVTITPGRRFGDDDEALALADLNAAGAPLMQLAPNSVGTSQLITADVVAIISESLLGIRLVYTFPEAKLVVNGGLNLELVTLQIPEARVGDPVEVTQIIGLNLEMNADCTVNGEVHLRGYAIGAAVTIPAGTVITIIVFTSFRVLPRGPAFGPPDAAGTTGYLTVTPGYNWADGEALATDKLDKTCQPDATIPTASIGRRELSAPDVEKLAAPVVGGTAFKGKVAVDITIAPHNYTFFAITVPGATVGQVPVLHGGPLLWRGWVNAVNSVVIVVQNVTNIAATLLKGTVFQGRLI